MLNNQYSVSLVVGNRLLRESLARLLEKKGGFHVCGVFSCAPDSISEIGTSGAEILILDSSTARTPDFAFISAVAAQEQNIKVMLIDMDCDPDIFLQSVRAGASGYMLRDASAAEVMAGVQGVARGLAICPPQLCAHLFRVLSRQRTNIPSLQIKLELGLTRRQQQLVPLIHQGLTNKEIGSRLNISEQTVKNHIHEIMRRTGANDRFQVIDQTRLRSAFQ